MTKYSITLTGEIPVHSAGNRSLCMTELNMENIPMAVVVVLPLAAALKRGWEI